jgi:hypothetical protein
MIAFVDEYFAMIPEETRFKRPGLHLAGAYTAALLALNAATPESKARQFARVALRRDPYWISNRHVVARALG